MHTQDSMQVYHNGCFAMGTRFNMVLPGISEKKGRRLAIEVSRILVEEEARISCFSKTSEISKINNLARGRPYSVSEQMTTILDTCQQYYRDTDGAFDPGLLKINTRIRSENYHSTPLAQTGVGWCNVDWDPSQREILIKSRNTGIDMGGFGKGWALGKVRIWLIKRGISSAFVSFGESTIATIGRHPLGVAWQVAVAHPATGVATLLELNGHTMSVSGLRVRGVNESASYTPHIYKPVSKTMADDNTIVIAKTDKPVEAEVLSTAIMAASLSQKHTILKNFPNASFLQCGANDTSFSKITLELG